MLGHVLLGKIDVAEKLSYLLVICVSTPGPQYLHLFESGMMDVCDGEGVDEGSLTEVQPHRFSH